MLLLLATICALQLWIYRALFWAHQGGMGGPCGLNSRVTLIGSTWPKGKGTWVSVQKAYVSGVPILTSYVTFSIEAVRI